MRLLDEDGEESRVYGESPEFEGYRETVGEERRDMPPFSEQGEMHVEDGSSREDTAGCSRREEEQVNINEVVDE